MHRKIFMSIIKITCESYKTVLEHNRWLWLSPLIFLIWGINLASFDCLHFFLNNNYTSLLYWFNEPVHLSTLILVLLLLILALTGRFLLTLCFFMRWMSFAKRHEPITLRNLFLFSRNTGAVLLCFFLNVIILLVMMIFFTLLCIFSLLHGLTFIAEILLLVFTISAVLSFIYIQLCFFIIYPTAAFNPDSPLRTGFCLARHHLGKIFLIDFLTRLPLGLISIVVYQYALLSSHNYGIWAVLSLVSTAALVIGNAIGWAAQAHSYTAITEGFIS